MSGSRLGVWVPRDSMQVAIHKEPRNPRRESLVGVGDFGVGTEQMHTSRSWFRTGVGLVVGPLATEVEAGVGNPKPGKAVHRPGPAGGRDQ